MCLVPAIISISLMIGYDPDGVPLNKPALLAARIISVNISCVLPIILAWNAS